MNKFRSFLKLELVLAALVIVTAAGVYLATTPQTDAVIVVGPGAWIYYSNGSYTTVVGARGNGCCGSVISWGITTQFKKFEKIYCTDQICPNYILALGGRERAGLGGRSGACHSRLTVDNDRIPITIR
jgi:hypothetical protein